MVVTVPQLHKVTEIHQTTDEFYSVYTLPQKGPGAAIKTKGVDSILPGSGIWAVVCVCSEKSVPSENSPFAAMLCITNVCH